MVWINNAEREETVRRVFALEANVWPRHVMTLLKTLILGRQELIAVSWRVVRANCVPWVKRATMIVTAKAWFALAPQEGVSLLDATTESKMEKKLVLMLEGTCVSQGVSWASIVRVTLIVICR